MSLSPLKKPRAHYQWRGARVVTTQTLQNALAAIPAGSEGVVEGATRGLSVRFDACPHCGVQLRLTGLRPEMLEIMAYPAPEGGVHEAQ